jgi:AAA family ATP:ADP antiporter
VRRATDFALAKPARESLFTVVSREDKYKAKNFIDTFLYRAGDAVGAGGFALLTSHWIGLGLQEISMLVLPLGALWLAVALWLGRRQRVLSQNVYNEHEPSS